MSAKPGTCLHCNQPRAISGRGLCTTCYTTPAIRRLYPVIERGHIPRYREPTEEEVEAMVAEQMKNLPAWWGKSGAAAFVKDD